jgi:hypothetical protein
MTRPPEDRVRALLRGARVPGETAAEDRGWLVVREAFAGRSPAPPDRPWRARAALALLGAGAAAALALTPAGADVREWIAEAITGEESATPVLDSLPAPGAVLTESRDGAWILEDDGSRRRLGEYDHVTWSANGLYVGASAGDELLALDPRGVVRWTLTAQAAIEAIDWSSDEGYRVAYVAGSRLFVVPGDKSEAPEAIGSVDSPAIAWRPEANPAAAVHNLAYVDGAGRLTVRDTDSGTVLGRTPPLSAPAESIQWSADGERLMVLEGGSVLVFDAFATTPIKGPVATGVSAATIAPGGERIAVVRPGRNGGAELALVPAFPGTAAERVLYRSGVPGSTVRFGDPVFSPDGQWLLLPWPQPDQWLFVPVKGGRVEAVADVSRVLDPDRRGEASFPRVAGWCC